MSPFSLGAGAGPLSTTGEDWAGRVAGPWGTLPQVPEYLEPTVVNCGHPCGLGHPPLSRGLCPGPELPRYPVGAGSEALGSLVSLFWTLSPASLLENPSPLRPGTDAASSSKPVLASLLGWGFSL